MADMSTAMRRVITGDDPSGDSIVIIDGPPASTTGAPELGGLFDIWHDIVSGPLNPQNHEDLGPTRNVLSPDVGKVKVRWFVITPRPPGVPADTLNAYVRERFRSFDAEDHLTDQS